MLGTPNGDSSEQSTVWHEIAGAMLRYGFLTVLLIGAWQDMKNHRMKLSLIVVLGAVEVIVQYIYAMLRVVVRYQISVSHLSFGFIADQFKDTVMVMAVGGGLPLLSWVTNEAVGKGDGWFLLVSDTYLGTVENLALLAGGLGICFLPPVALMFRGILQGTDRKRLRIPLLPFLIPAGIGVMFVWKRKRLR